VKPGLSGIHGRSESDEAMLAALNSPEMAAAIEDAQNFLDMDRTGMVVVAEKTVVG
jgi:hypothetical protein